MFMLRLILVLTASIGVGANRVSKNTAGQSSLKTDRASVAQNFSAIQWGKPFQSSKKVKCGEATFTVVDYGMWGSRQVGGLPSNGGKIEDGIGEPLTRDTTMVDPNCEGYIGRNNPELAIEYNTISGHIYDRLNIWEFPEDVQEALCFDCKPGTAKMHQYDPFKVIHVKAPDLWETHPVDFHHSEGASHYYITESFINIFKEFGENGGGKKLRILPPSYDTFAGPWGKEIKEMTFTALKRAFDNYGLDRDYQALHFCKKAEITFHIYEAEQYKEWAEAAEKFCDPA